MKKYIYSLLILLSVGCSDYLDVIPDNLATIEILFNNRTTAERFMSTCYSYIPEHANVISNFSLVAGDDIWYYTEKDFYVNNEISFRLAKGLQNVNDPYCNYWEGRQGGTNIYIAIRDCNIFLENIKSIPGINVIEKARWIAEVKTLKAYYHFWLLQMYGPIPIIDTNVPVSANTEATLVYRSSVDDVVKYIVSLIDDVVKSKGLPDSIQFVDTETGRITMPVAKAIKAKVLMLAASPLFNGNPDYSSFVGKDGGNLVNSVYDPLKWVAAKDACKDAIETANASGHKLYEFNKILPIAISPEIKTELTQRATLTDKILNPELIWGVGNGWTLDLQCWSQPRWTGDHVANFNWTKQSHAPTLNMVEDYYTSKGLPIDEDKTWDYANRFNLVETKTGTPLQVSHKYYIQKDFTTVNFHTYREPRFYAYVGFDGGKWLSGETTNIENIPFLSAKRGQTAGFTGFGSELYSSTGYFSKKLVNYENVITTNGFNVERKTYTFPIIRLSDLYLMYSEALNEVKDAPDAEVYEYIQKVRTKAGLDIGSDLVTTWATYSTNPNKPKTKEGMRAIIRRERIIELSFEGQRYWDLRRWKLAEDYFNKPIRGWNIYGGDAKSYYNVINLFYRNYLAKDYLWPISQTEMLKNPNLVQSPGW
jgi:hypothetical protein